MRLPAYNLTYIEATRQRLADEVLPDFYGCDCSGTTFNELVRVLRKDLHCKRNVMEDTVRYLAGQRLTETQIRTLCWRLAGNVSRLQHGQAVPPWSSQLESEWIPVHVHSYEQEINQYNNMGGRFTFQALAGTPCPLQFTAFWSTGLCSLIAQQAGYTNRRGKRPYSHLTELVNLYLYVHVDPQYCIQGRVGFRQVACSGMLRTRNRVIIDKRRRLQGHLPWPCPNGYDSPCYKCFVGYRNCPAATHPTTLTVANEQTSSPNPQPSEG